MHPCPCCGYKTLPERGGYELCPVCWWEDQGLEPWQFSDANGMTLVEAQQEFLADRRPGKVRAPKKREARDPDWRPFEVTDELMAQVQESHRRERQMWAEYEENLEEPPQDAWLEDYNAAHRALSAEAEHLSHSEVKKRLRGISSTAHGPMFGEAHLELMSRWMKDEKYYRGHPVRTAWWLVRYARPHQYRRYLQEVRTGTIYMAG